MIANKVSYLHPPACAVITFTTGPQEALHALDHRHRPFFVIRFEEVPLLILHNAFKAFCYNLCHFIDQAANTTRAVSSILSNAGVEDKGQVEPIMCHVDEGGHVRVCAVGIRNNIDPLAFCVEQVQIFCLQ